MSYHAAQSQSDPGGSAHFSKQAYTASLWHAFLCTKPVQTSSVSESRMSSIGIVSSSSELLPSLVLSYEDDVWGVGAVGAPDCWN